MHLHDLLTSLNTCLLRHIPWWACVPIMLVFSISKSLHEPKPYSSWCACVHACACMHACMRLHACMHAPACVHVHYDVLLDTLHIGCQAFSHSCVMPESSHNAWFFSKFPAVYEFSVLYRSMMCLTYRNLPNLTTGDCLHSLEPTHRK